MLNCGINLAHHAQRFHIEGATLNEIKICFDFLNAHRMGIGNIALDNDS